MAKILGMSRGTKLYKRQFLRTRLNGKEQEMDGNQLAQVYFAHCSQSSLGRQHEMMNAKQDIHLLFFFYTTAICAHYSVFHVSYIKETSNCCIFSHSVFKTLAHQAKWTRKKILFTMSCNNNIIIIKNKDVLV